MNRYASFGLALALILGLGTLDPVAAQNAAGNLSGSGAVTDAGRPATAGAEPNTTGDRSVSPASTIGTAQNDSSNLEALVDESLLTFPDADQAQAEGSAGASEAVEAVGIGDLFRMILVLALILAAIYGIFWFIKKGRKLGSSPDEDSLIRLQDQLSLGGTRMVQVIEIGAHTYLLGVSDAGIELLSEITDQETIQELRLRASKRESTPKQGFSQMLGAFVERGGFKAKPAHKTADAQKGKAGLDFLGSASERLKKW